MARTRTDRIVQVRYVAGVPFDMNGVKRERKPKRGGDRSEPNEGGKSAILSPEHGYMTIEESDARPDSR